MSKTQVEVPEYTWEETFEAVKKTRLTKPRTVALVGFAKSSRNLAPYDQRNLEIWGCNEAYTGQFMKTSKGEFRADRWFQIHKREDWSRRNNPNDPHHPEWLSRDHNFPIYMQEEFEEVPDAEAIPLAELDEMFFSNLWAIHPETGKYVPWLEAYEHGNYTSTFAWMMAMAIYEGFDRIQVYGFAMGTKSEYLHQAPGATFWIGQALGRGIDIQIIGASPILQGDLYGFGFGSILQVGVFDERIAELEPYVEQARTAAAFVGGKSNELAAIRRLFPDLGDDVSDELEQRAKNALDKSVESTTTLSFFRGALRCATGLRGHIVNRQKENPEFRIEDGWVDRLSLELQLRGVRMRRDGLVKMMAQAGGARLEITKALEDGAYSEEVREAMDARRKALTAKEIGWAEQINFVLGVVNQLHWFIMKCDSAPANMSDQHDFGAAFTLTFQDDELDVLVLEAEKLSSDIHITTKEEDDEVGGDDNGGQEDPPEDA